MLTIKYMLICGNEIREYHDCIKYLSKERQTKICRLKKDKDKSLSLIAGLLVRTQLAIKSSTPPLELHFERVLNGKLIVKDIRDVYFSISHSNALIVYADDTGEIGIDCEKIGTADVTLFENVLSENEKLYLMRNNCTEKSFHEIWTKKESYVKMTGEGITDQFGKVDVMNIANEVYFYTTQIKNYMVTICSNNMEHADVKIVPVHIDDVIWHIKNNSYIEREEYVY